MMCNDSQEDAGRTIRTRSALLPVSYRRGLEPEARGKLGLAEAELLAQGSHVDHGCPVDFYDGDPNPRDVLALRKGERCFALAMSR